MELSTCAFCLTSGSQWRYVLQDERIVEACETCRDMVDNANWGGLLCRRLYGLGLEERDERTQGCIEALSEWAQFELQRKGPADPMFLNP